MKKRVILALITICALSFSACGSQQKPTSISESVESITDTSTSEVVSVEEPEVVDNAIRDLTTDEVKFFTEFIQESENIGFSFDNYTDPKEIDVNKVFIDGIFKDNDPITEEEYKEYLEITEQEEIFSSVVRCRVSDVDRILKEKCDVNFADIDSYFEGYWFYNADRDAYYSERGGVDYVMYNVDDGFFMPEGNYYVLHLSPTELFDYGSSDGYRQTRKELCLQKRDDGSYKFVSCRELIDEDLITEWCYNVVVCGLGKCQLMVYSPMRDDTDITLKLTKDGEEIYTLYDESNLLEDKSFESIIDMGFADFDYNGTPDLLLIKEYKTNKGEFEYKKEVFTSDVNGYFVRNADYMEYIKDYPILSFENMSAYLIGPTGGCIPFQQIYINVLKENDLDIMDDLDDDSGFTLIYLDEGTEPELVACGAYSAAGSKVVGIDTATGEPFINYLNSLDFNYMDHQRLLDDRYGYGVGYGEGVIYDTIYEYNNGVLELIAEGTYYENDEDEENQCMWNGEPIDAVDYEMYLTEVYNLNYASNINSDSLLSREEMISLLNLEYSKLF